MIVSFLFIGKQFSFQFYTFTFSENITILMSIMYLILDQDVRIMFVSYFRLSEKRNICTDIFCFQRSETKYVSILFFILGIKIIAPAFRRLLFILCSIDIGKFSVKPIAEVDSYYLVTDTSRTRGQ